MRLLITGITGFVGSHMAEHALAHGAEVFGSSRWRSKTEHIEHLRVAHHPHRVRPAGSVLGAGARRESTARLRRASGRAELRGRVLAGAGGDARRRISPSQVNLLEAIRALAAPAALPRVSGAARNTGWSTRTSCPIRETNPLRPLSPYAVSKVTQDVMGYQYFKSYGLPIVRTRAFNHEGPRRGDVFVTSNFAKQVAEIEAGLREPVVRVGDLKPRRDFSDVRDIVRGYWLLLERGEPGEVYNLCSGRAWSIQQVLDFLVGAVHGEGHRRRGRSGAAPALRRDGPGRRPVEDREGHGVEGGDSLRAHAHGAPRLLAGAGASARRAELVAGADAMRVALVHDWLTGMRGGERCLEVVLRAVPRRRPLHAAPRAGLRLARHRAAPDRHLVHPAAARRGAPDTAATSRCFPPPSAASTSAATTSCCPRATPWPRRSASRRARCTSATASRRCATSGISTTSTSARARAWPTRAAHAPASPPRSGAGTGAPRPASTTSWRSRASSRTASGAPTAATADVIYPPVDVARFAIEETPGDYYLVVSALAPYKRVDLAVEAANRTAAPAPRRGDGPGGAAAASHRRSHRRDARLAGRRRGRASCTRAVAALLFPTARGFRHHAPRGHGGRAAR